MDPEVAATDTTHDGAKPANPQPMSRSADTRHTSAKARMTMNAKLRGLPRRCSSCGRTIDWLRQDRHRAPGLLEDGVPLCADCVHRARRVEAA